MQFSAVLVAFLTSAPLLVSITPPKLSYRLMPLVSAMADLHKELMCINYVAGPDPVAKHNDATKSACAAYKARDPGINKWESCPDCAVEERYEVAICTSDAGHLGGDEFEAYCQEFGAAASMHVPNYL
ncbi:hypothetical protein CH63R_00104 [Colletotrichum higginsianum IMI 349063]|uniref:Uncharacterized protein n=2 Tax=Colletotrichum higginsianum TaxID=80884 RepID=A0A1B7YSJ1_COLHI|nr:hypothetical protein CH63R_00104 [Colletotrichum higginsianum IMI 349063]OBR14924.1 hypothetical protein CH63R_00104 [Colletotrichum higginsianum IMI 349063]TID04939.1 hypothetical protein CH35J_003226 [Colletotrichum higginsianum]